MTKTYAELSADAAALIVAMRTTIRRVCCPRGQIESVLESAKTLYEDLGKLVESADQCPDSLFTLRAQLAVVDVESPRVAGEDPCTLDRLAILHAAVDRFRNDVAGRRE